LVCALFSSVVYAAEDPTVFFLVPDEAATDSNEIAMIDVGAAADPTPQASPQPKIDPSGNLTSLAIDLGRRVLDARIGYYFWGNRVEAGADLLFDLSSGMGYGGHVELTPFPVDHFGNHFYLVGHAYRVYSGKWLNRYYQQIDSDELHYFHGYSVGLGARTNPKDDGSNFFFMEVAKGPLERLLADGTIEKRKPILISIGGGYYY
jgi:hypothetical protein